MNNLSKQPLNPSNYVWTKHLGRPQPISQWRAAHYVNAKLNVLFTPPKQCPDPNPQTSPAEASLMACDRQKQSLIGCLTRSHANTTLVRQDIPDRINYANSHFLQPTDKPTQGWMKLAQQKRTRWFSC